MRHKGTTEGRRTITGAASSGSEIGAPQATGENVAANTTAEATAAGDAFRSQSVEHGIHISRRSRTRRRFYNERTGDSTAARAVRVHSVQDGFHTSLEMGEAGEQREKGRGTEGTARDFPEATGWT